MSVLALAFLAPPISAQNADIDSWNPLASVTRSPDVRVRNVATVLGDYFTPVENDQQISPIKSENAIYVRFRNGSATPIPQGNVTVTAHYAEAAPGIADAALEGSLAGLVWQPFGSYTMNLVILPSDPPGYGLLPGLPGYPTSREVGDPSRYRILCTLGCTQPLPTSFFLRITLSGDIGATNNVAFSYYDLTAGVPPADVVILHDVSGSMSPFLAAAQQRAKMFVDLLNAGDRVGVAAFSSQFAGDAHTAASLAQIVTIDPLSDPAKMNAKTGIDSFMASGWTPMGAGVLEAQQVLNAALPPYPANRAIVMLTDGKENRDPRLNQPPFTILDGLNTDANGAIGLYPLWFGTISNWGKSLLENVLLNVDEGKLVDQPNDDLELAKAYLVIRGILTSDDIYAIHRGTTGDGYQGSIFVDPVTEELIVTAAWRTFGRELDVEVQLPGDPAWRSPARVPGVVVLRDQLYVVYRFQHAAKGQWRYRIAATDFDRDGREEYVLSALADQVEVLLQSSLAQRAVAAGEPIEIRARLTRKGEAVAGATVTASVRVPDQALGTLLHRHRDRFQTPSAVSTQPDRSRAAGILKELRGILGRDQIFAYGNRNVPLQDPDGDGVYSGRFLDTRVAGTYSIAITAERQAGPGADGFRRDHRHAAVVSLGAIDPGRSVVQVDRLDRIGRQGASIWRVTVVPADVQGNFADPDYAGRIRVDSSGGTWLDDLTDNDDGSYSRHLELAAGQDAKIRVNAFGVELPERDTGPGARAPGKRQWSLHWGTAFPSGDFDRAFDRGSSFSLDFGYRWRPRVTALLFAGLHDFPHRGAAGSETVLELSANLRRRLAGSRLAPYVQGGPGAYRIFDQWEPGLNLGLGLTFEASPQVDLEGGADYHTIFLSGSDARSWRLHAGFSLRR